MTFPVLADGVGVHSGAVLAYIPSPPRGVWDVGPFPLRAYALCIIVGIIVAIWWGERRWRERGGQPGAVLDVAMFAVPFGLVGGRLYHVATDWEKYFGAGGHPIDALKIWEGGLGIWGAVLLGGIGAWIGCRVYRIPLPAFGDAIAPGILLAQAVGRLGNYFNQELYGRATDLPWGLEIDLRFDSNGQLDMMNGVSTGVVEKVVQPTFLYELIWNLLGVLVLVLVDRRWKVGHGRLFALYVAIYTFGRFWVELLRDDDATHLFGIRINSYTSAIVFLCAVAYFIFATKGRETAAQLAPAGDRPWPWQWGALRRRAAAEQAAADSGDAVIGDAPAANGGTTGVPGGDAGERAPDGDPAPEDAAAEKEETEPTTDRDAASAPVDETAGAGEQAAEGTSAGAGTTTAADTGAPASSASEADEVAPTGAAGKGARKRGRKQADKR